MYITISDKYIKNFPSEDTWKDYSEMDIPIGIIKSWKNEGKLEILKEIISKNKDKE